MQRTSISIFWLTASLALCLIPTGVPQDNAYLDTSKAKNTLTNPYETFVHQQKTILQQRKPELDVLDRRKTPASLHERDSNDAGTQKEHLSDFIDSDVSCQISCVLKTISPSSKTDWNCGWKSHDHICAKIGVVTREMMRTAEARDWTEPFLVNVSGLEGISLDTMNIFQIQDYFMADYSKLQSFSMVKTQ